MIFNNKPKLIHTFNYKSGLWPCSRRKKDMIEIHVYSVAGNKQITERAKQKHYILNKKNEIYICLNAKYNKDEEYWKNGVHVVQPAICRALSFIKHQFLDGHWWFQTLETMHQMQNCRVWYIRTSSDICGPEATLQHNQFPFAFNAGETMHGPMKLIFGDWSVTVMYRLQMIAGIQLWVLIPPLYRRPFVRSTPHVDVPFCAPPFPSETCPISFKLLVTPVWQSRNGYREGGDFPARKLLGSLRSQIINSIAV